MNYLAHIALSNLHHGCIVGNIMEDFIVGSYTHQRNVWVKEKYYSGIKLHRFIDDFTDRNEHVLKCIHLLHINHGKFSPVIMDIFFDYFLARHWHNFYNDNLLDYAQKVYNIFTLYWHDFPPKMQLMLKNMIEHNWLIHYSEKNAIQKALNHISSKSKYKNTMYLALEDLIKYEAFFETQFLEFYPKLQKACNVQMERMKE